MINYFDNSESDTLKYNNNFIDNQYKLFSIIDAKHDFGEGRAPGIKNNINTYLLDSRNIKQDSEIKMSYQSLSQPLDTKTFKIDKPASTLHSIIDQTNNDNLYDYTIQCDKHPNLTYNFTSHKSINKSIYNLNPSSISSVVEEIKNNNIRIINISDISKSNPDHKIILKDFLEQIPGFTSAENPNKRFVVDATKLGIYVYNEILFNKDLSNRNVNFLSDNFDPATTVSTDILTSEPDITKKYIIPLFIPYQSNNNTYIVLSKTDSNSSDTNDKPRLKIKLINMNNDSLQQSPAVPEINVKFMGSSSVPGVTGIDNYITNHIFTPNLLTKCIQFINIVVNGKTNIEWEKYFNVLRDNLFKPNLGTDATNKNMLASYFMAIKTAGDQTRLFDAINLKCPLITNDSFLRDCNIMSDGVPCIWDGGDNKICIYSKPFLTPEQIQAQQIQENIKQIKEMKKNIDFYNEKINSYYELLDFMNWDVYNMSDESSDESSDEDNNDSQNKLITNIENWKDQALIIKNDTSAILSINKVKEDLKNIENIEKKAKIATYKGYSKYYFDKLKSKLSNTYKNILNNNSEVNIEITSINNRKRVQNLKLDEKIILKIQDSDPDFEIEKFYYNLIHECNFIFFIKLIEYCLILEKFTKYDDNSNIENKYSIYDISNFELFFTKYEIYDFSTIIGTQPRVNIEDIIKNNCKLLENYFTINKDNQLETFDIRFTNKIPYLNKLSKYRNIILDKISFFEDIFFGKNKENFNNLINKYLRIEIATPNYSFYKNIYTRLIFVFNIHLQSGGLPKQKSRTAESIPPGKRLKTTDQRVFSQSSLNPFFLQKNTTLRRRISNKDRTSAASKRIATRKKAIQDLKDKKLLTIREEQPENNMIDKLEELIEKILLKNIFIEDLNEKLNKEISVEYLHKKLNEYIKENSKEVTLIPQSQIEQSNEYTFNVPYETTIINDKFYRMFVIANLIKNLAIINSNQNIISKNLLKFNIKNTISKKTNKISKKTNKISKKTNKISKKTKKNNLK